MCKLIEWPDYDQADVFRFNKVINERDFLPLHVVRTRAQAITLVRAQRGNLVATPLGKSMLSDERQGSLPAILFHITFWRMDLGYFGRALLGSWPQADAGVAPWSLSVCGNTGNQREADAIMQSRSRPFCQGLGKGRPTPWRRKSCGRCCGSDYRSEKIPNSRFGARHYYRKTALFDRLLTFEVRMDLAESPSH